MNIDNLLDSVPLLPIPYPPFVIQLQEIRALLVDRGTGRTAIHAWAVIYREADPYMAPAKLASIVEPELQVAIPMVGTVTAYDCQLRPDFYEDEYGTLVYRR